jgi:hypothetical protein
MLSKIRNWFLAHEMQCTWFIIGTFATWFIVDIERQNYIGALIDLIIVVINYIYRPR